MRTRPLGCMTFTALVAGVIALLAIAGVILTTGNSLFSPGGLSAYTQPGAATLVSAGGVTSHAQLEGRCDACHVAIWSGQRMGDKCLDCHSDVAQQSATGKGLHGKLDATAATCLRCHTEHHGATASTTLADPHVFPHEETGFVLTAHARPAVANAVGCRECHANSPRDYAAPDCASCHQKLDAAKMAKHTDTYGSACLNCHDGKDTYGHAFAHTTYALTGKHSGADCASCHKGSTTLAALRTTSTACATCHAKDDIHGGRLGQSCGTCHTPGGWAGAQLDHTSQTTFALAGKHAAVACESCHVNRQWTGLGTTCASCHAKDDPHAGKFGSDCASCHNPSDWKDAKFDHSTTGFSLAQAHASVSCDKCHANKRFAGTPTNCAGCHASQDKHNGVLGTTCEQCHTATQWSSASYNHNSAAFKLVGAHTGVTCEKCHTKAPPASTATSCVGCHAAQDAHNGSMGSNCETCHKPTAWMDVSVNHNAFPFKLTGAHAGVSCSQCHKDSTPKNTPTACASCHTKPTSHDSHFSGVCSSCHTTKAWRPAAFNHATTSYKLTGAHLSVTCLKCHTHPSVTYTGAPTVCASCHKKPANHTGAMGSNCGQCHTTRGWSPSTFNHSTTSFPLTGAHTKLLCTKCHTSPTSFGGLPTSCVGCHNKPSNHPSSYGTVCTLCHTTTAWLPIHYTGPHTFPMTHHGAGGVCANCHAATLSGYSCAKCHANAHGGNRDQSKCASCHPDGRGGD